LKGKKGRKEEVEGIEDLRRGWLWGDYSSKPFHIVIIF